VLLISCSCFHLLHQAVVLAAMQHGNEQLLGGCWRSLSRPGRQSDATVSPLTALSIAIVSNSTVLQTTRYPRCAGRRPGAAGHCHCGRPCTVQCSAHSAIECWKAMLRVECGLVCLSAASGRAAVPAATALCRSGENVHTSMIVIEIRQVTNEALLKTMQPARVLVATKASAVGQCP
jgi:hypothetical protein